MDISNKLYYGDNLRILRDYIKDESVDLIYLDPPFDSKSDYNILYKEPSGEQSQAQITAFEDSWHWTEESERTFQDIIETAPPMLVEMMLAFRKFVGVNDVMAYLTMMAIRLLELKRVLKDTGSIFIVTLLQAIILKSLWTQYLERKTLETRLSGTTLDAE